MLSTFFMVIHLSKYSYDGEGLLVCDVFGRVFKIIAQVGIIMISFRLAITKKEDTDFDIYIASTIFVIIMHLAIVGLSYIDNDQYHKFHDFGGIQGFILIVFRLILYAAFVY